MKDAQGHGSDPRGMANRDNAGNHQAGVLRVGRPGLPQKVQALSLASKYPGIAWENAAAVRGRVRTVGYGPNARKVSAVAERVAQRVRIDNPDRLIRVRMP